MYHRGVTKVVYFRDKSQDRRLAGLCVHMDCQWPDLTVCGRQFRRSVCQVLPGTRDRWLLVREAGCRSSTHSLVCTCLFCACTYPTTMFLTLLAAVPLVVLLYAFLVPNPTPIFGKYSRPGKWFWVKYCFMYAMLWVRRQQDARRKKVSGENAGWGKRSRSSPEEMDKAQSLSKDHPMVSVVPQHDVIITSILRQNDAVTSTVLT